MAATARRVKSSGGRQRHPPLVEAPDDEWWDESPSGKAGEKPFTGTTTASSWGFSTGDAGGKPPQSRESSALPPIASEQPYQQQPPDAGSGGSSRASGSRLPAIGGAPSRDQGGPAPLKNSGADATGYGECPAPAFCTQCGNRLAPNVRYCSACGSPVLPMDARYHPGAKSLNGSMTARAPLGPQAAMGYTRPAPLSARAPPSQKLALSKKRLSKTQPNGFFATRRDGGMAQEPKDARATSSVAALAQDTTLQSIAMRMRKALAAFYQQRGVHHNVASNWSQFFADVDGDGNGLMAFKEFDETIRGRLKTDVSRYELRLFWRRMDADGSGLVTPKEFTLLMYRIDLSTWPHLEEEHLNDSVAKLNNAAEKWHHSGGNWGKIFKQLDTDGSGKLSFDEFKRCVRGSLPALQMSAKDISDNDLMGTWKALDTEGAMEVRVDRFMAFMRRHGSALTMHRLTSYSKKMRGLEEQIKALGPTPDRTKDALRSIAERLAQALQAYFSDRGVHAITHSTEGNWRHFFDEVDTDHSGRLNFLEFMNAVTSKLSKWWLAPPADDERKAQDDLHALWVYMDPDKSGEVTAKELKLCLYKLELEFWPDADEGTLQRVVQEMNQAVEKWHRAGGNWYKVFNLVDPRNSGHVTFNEMRHLMRGRFPALDITTDRLPEEDLRAFWKALDCNLSGDTTVKEFMLFMRQHGASHSMHRITRYSRAKRGLDTGGRDVAAELAAAPVLEDAEVRDVATRLSDVLVGWLSKRGIHSGTALRSTASPQLWEELFNFVDSDHSGRLNFVEYEHAVKNVLKAGSKIPDDEIRAFWVAVDNDGSGEVTTAEFCSAVYKLQLDTWPLLDEPELVRLVSVLNASADKWHRCSGNWYKVFAMVDEDGSGEMGFDEMRVFLRRAFPCLSLTPKDISDVEICGLWRALDADKSGRVTTKEFMAFMRRHGSQHSMHRLTTYSLEKRGLLTQKERPGTPPERSRRELQATARALDEALSLYWSSRGVHSNIDGSWARLFAAADADGSKRLGFFELKGALREKLLPRKDAADGSLVIKGVTHEDLLALWAEVDADGSGEVTPEEWFRRLYQLELETWPDADELTLNQTVDKLSDAADKWHGAGGNWYKVFRLVDSDDSGKMHFEEMREIVRRRLPCLAIPADQLPERELRAFWKALDADCSGEVTIPEFMKFMRRHGSKRQLHEKLSSARAARASQVTSRAMSRAAAENDKTALSPEEHELLADALQAQSYQSVKDAYETCEILWSGSVSEWDFMSLVRDFLGIGEEDLDDDGVYLAWKSLDTKDAGSIKVEAMLAFGKRKFTSTPTAASLN